MEIKIGLANSPKELIVESAQTSAEVAASVHETFEIGRVLQLAEANGRVVLVPSSQIAYVDISPTNPRPIGFGALSG